MTLVIVRIFTYTSLLTSAQECIAECSLYSHEMMFVPYFSCAVVYIIMITSPEVVCGIYNMSIGEKTGRHGASEKQLLDIEIMPDVPNLLGLVG